MMKRGLVAIFDAKSGDFCFLINFFNMGVFFAQKWIQKEEIPFFIHWEKDKSQLKTK